MSKRICVVGLGYIGLPTAALLANKGFEVVGVDVNEQVVRTINAGQAHLVEPDLDTFVRAAVESHRLEARLQPDHADVFMICVPTPLDTEADPPQPDISYVVEASRAIAPWLRPGNLVILESTSPVGTTERVVEVLREAGAPVDRLHIAYCPERVLPGRVIVELIENDRIVGGVNEAATRAVADFYHSFVLGEVLTTQPRVAELAKLAENAFRDVNIAYANELSMICERLGIDAWELIRLANRHPRVNILQPGAGVGGHCIAVDPWFIVAGAPEEARLIRTAREVNDRKTLWALERIAEAAARLPGLDGRAARIACLGLAFKPNIDDLRESPAQAIARNLRDGGYEVLPVEPNLERSEEWVLRPLAEALAEADLVVVLVRHRDFAYLDAGGKPLLDFCGLLAGGK